MKFSKVFSLYRGHHGLTVCHGVVTSQEGDPLDLHVPSSEAIRVALPGIDEDRQGFDCRAGTRDPGAGVGGLGCFLGLPEDRRTPAGLREHELGTGEAGSIEHQVNHGSASPK
jgi:hypothetical protein